MMQDIHPLLKNKHISAFCILCHDADSVLPFYQDVLGYELRRAEESFYAFDKRGSATTLCLWEIGHIAEHTVFETYSPSSIPNKIILSLNLATQQDVDSLYDNLQKENVRLLSSPSKQNDYRFAFIDPCSMIWEVQINESGNPQAESIALDRITLICQDLNGTKAFYEEKLCYPSSPEVDGRVTYPAVNNTSLSLWDYNSAAGALGLPTLKQQQPAWTAHTAMLAYAYDHISQLESLHDKLAGSGFTFDHAPAYFDWDFSACYFRDPENNIWELFEMPQNIDQRMLPS